ncbi:MAG TPA: hypothetical protein VFX22_00130, partial [Candidatus Kapabacteria bacterium]|nr:hypothetical protein [Candidatus Kapabacteria bacterium]
LTLPYSGTTASQVVFQVKSTNATAGIALRGETNSTDNYPVALSGAVYGTNTNGSPAAAAFGVAGTTNSGFANSAGVYGYNSAPGGGAGASGFGHYGIVGSAAPGGLLGAGVYGSDGGIPGANGVYSNGDLYVNGNATINSTGAIIVPVGTSAQRPGTPVQGMIRFNTTTNKFEGYDGVTWQNLN